MGINARDFLEKAKFAKTENDIVEAKKLLDFGEELRTVGNNSCISIKIKGTYQDQSMEGLLHLLDQFEGRKKLKVTSWFFEILDDSSGKYVCDRILDIWITHRPI